ncbi:MAG: prephenate dehydrogenase/arogenate dehydrogenase family protein [Betaproteobacteria bacterium]|nr:prephenate dehydrogenase/arogenate dehydrogenase family protein [Betaproteobacteria bacterium]MCH9848535.1 prephenate dehydrogenase/arogenate dehydrogenase family protein [Betaproteobacteria bacterium]
MLKKLVIFGVGLIGGSVALALKKQANAPLCVGVGRNKANLEQALALHIIDEAATDIAAALQDADMVLIAAPVAQTKSILQSIQPHLNQQTVITDAGSTKTDIVAIAKAVLGAQASQFIGGHPIAGAEKSGPSAAMADLYHGKNVVLTPTNDNSQENVNLVRQLWQTCGANVLEMSAEKHDGIFATVSHLPHLLAFALVEDIASRDNADELFQFAASGFRDFTRIAGSSPEMWRDISFANKAALLDEITSYEQALSSLKQSLKNNDADALQAAFKRASDARNQWAKDKKLSN